MSVERSERRLWKTPDQSNGPWNIGDEACLVAATGRLRPLHQLLSKIGHFVRVKNCRITPHGQRRLGGIAAPVADHTARHLERHAANVPNVLGFVRKKVMAAAGGQNYELPAEAVVLNARLPSFARSRPGPL